MTSCGNPRVPSSPWTGSMTDRLVNFILLCEGSSDQDLVAHLQTLLVRNGATEAIGTADYRKGTVEEKLRRVLSEGSSVDVVFVHRDADSRKHAHRHDEVANQAAAAQFTMPCIGIVPVQMTEAWLLTDESAIRAVAGRPGGKVQLGLPAIGRIETTHNPKDVLRIALATASEASGRRLDREKRLFSARRRTLVQRLDPDGRVAQLPSWQRLEDAVAGYAATVWPRS